LGEAIRQVRTSCGLTAGELALASGVARDLIEALESGLLDPDFDLLLTLARTLGVRPSEFVTVAERLGAEAKDA
jgi:transcriptional regulator with XRE-family HTH domain